MCNQELAEDLVGDFFRFLTSMQDNNDKNKISIGILFILFLSVF